MFDDNTGLVTTVVQTGRGATVSVYGEIDVCTSPRMGRSLEAAAGLGQDLRVDLSGVTFLDASGLGVLVGSRNHSRRAGVDLVVVNPSPPVSRLLELTGQEWLLARGLRPRSDRPDRTDRTDWFSGGSSSLVAQ